MVGSWGLFPLVLSPLPSPNFDWYLVHAATCANFWLLVKYYPTFSEVFAGLVSKECLAVFHVTEVVFWTKPDLLMKKYFKNTLSDVAVEIYKEKKSILTNHVLNQHYLKRYCELLIIPESSSHVISLICYYYYLLFFTMLFFVIWKYLGKSKCRSNFWSLSLFFSYHGYDSSRLKSDIGVKKNQLAERFGSTPLMQTELLR